MAHPLRRGAGCPALTTLGVSSACADATQTNADDRLGHLDCLHAAVARTSGEVVFGLNGQIDDGRRKWGGLRVPAWSIDDLSGEYGVPDVVFIDVEGFEREALMGASETLRAGPDWFVEVHHPQELARYGTGSYRDIVECFDRRHYDLFAAPDGLALRDRQTLQSLTSFSPLDEVGAPHRQIGGDHSFGG